MPRFPGTNVEIDGTYAKQLREIMPRSDPPPPGGITIKGHDWKFTGSVAIVVAAGAWFFGTNIDSDHETRRVYREIEREAELNSKFRRDLSDRLDQLESKYNRDGQTLTNELTILQEQMRQLERAVKESRSD